MPDIRIDLDAPEPVAPARPWRRGLLAGAVVAALAAGAVLIRVLAPDDPVGPVDLRAEWSLALPDEFGEAVTARVQGGTVLVVAEHGLLAADRATGAERWRRSGDPPTEGEFARIAGNSLVLPGSGGFDVLDLPSGETRFSVSADQASVHLTLNSLVVSEPGRNLVAAYALSDGRELWSRELPERRWAALPAVMSGGRQPAGIANSRPGYTVPHGEFFLAIGETVEVRSLIDGDVLATWPYDQEGYEVLAPLGAYLVAVDAEANTIRALDPATGDELWKRDRLGGSESYDYAFADELLVDAGPEADAYRLIDLDTGDGPDPFDLGGRAPLAFGRDFVVAIDPELAELTAFGRVSWTTSLRPEGWTAAGFRPEGFLTGDGWLAIGGELGSGGETQRHLWAVELETGRIGSVPDGLLVGFENGALVSVASGDARTVRLHELGG